MAHDFSPKTAVQQLLESQYQRPIADVIRDKYESGLSQQQVADELGVSRQTLRQWMAVAGVPVRVRRAPTA